MYEYLALCERVVDGDTIDVRIDLGFDVSVKKRVRLLGINTPETYGTKKGSVEWQKGMDAKWFVTDLIEGKKIWVKTHLDKTGKYGRVLAQIYHAGLDAKSLNDLLVESGHAVVYGS